eukprot:m.856298 g.856298  ORF g.856298 m.856298 type:complete len:559 (-) comp23512_c0_seq11:562-2238(-)
MPMHVNHCAVFLRIVHFAILVWGCVISSSAAADEPQRVIVYSQGKSGAAGLACAISGGTGVMAPSIETPVASTSRYPNVFTTTSAAVLRESIDSSPSCSRCWVLVLVRNPFVRLASSWWNSAHTATKASDGYSIESSTVQELQQHFYAQAKNELASGRSWLDDTLRIVLGEDFISKSGLDDFDPSQGYQSLSRDDQVPGSCSCRVVMLRYEDALCWRGVLKEILPATVYDGRPCFERNDTTEQHTNGMDTSSDPPIMPACVGKPAEGASPARDKSQLSPAKQRKKEFLSTLSFPSELLQATREDPVRVHFGYPNSMPSELQSFHDTLSAEYNRAFFTTRHVGGHHHHMPEQASGLAQGTQYSQEGKPKLPDLVHVRCNTTKGTIRILVHRNWAPLGARRFLAMVDDGYFSAQVPLFRCVRRWICQFGMTKDPQVTRFWNQRGTILDDPQWLDLSNQARPWMRKGLFAYAGSGRNTRLQEFFVTTGSTNLGKGAWEVPFAELADASSFRVLDSFYTGYGEVRRFGGHAPDQGKINAQGGRYLTEFPNLDYITGCAKYQR